LNGSKTSWCHGSISCQWVSIPFGRLPI